MGPHWCDKQISNLEKDYVAPLLRVSTAIKLRLFFGLSWMMQTGAYISRSSEGYSWVSIVNGLVKSSGQPGRMVGDGVLR